MVAIVTLPHIINNCQHSTVDSDVSSFGPGTYGPGLNSAEHAYYFQHYGMHYQDYSYRDQIYKVEIAHDESFFFKYINIQ